MAEHKFDDDGMLGYFLPEDGQLLLKQLSGHIRFLARLAQPRVPDESEEWTPPVRTADLMFCLDQLAGQLDLVLGALSWPARREQVSGAIEVDRTTVPEAGLEQLSYSAHAREDGFAFGATVDQIDRLNGLISSIRAYGDVISAGGLGALTEGTLPALGNAIFEGANEARVLLSQVETQSITGLNRTRSAVREAPMTYDISVPVLAGSVGKLVGTIGDYLQPGGSDRDVSDAFPYPLRKQLAQPVPTRVW